VSKVAQWQAREKIHFSSDPRGGLGKLAKRYSRKSKKTKGEPEPIDRVTGEQASVPRKLSKKGDIQYELMTKKKESRTKRKKRRKPQVGAQDGGEGRQQKNI